MGQRDGHPLSRVELVGGPEPVLTAASATGVWVLDQHNGLSVMDTLSGRFFPVAQLPGDARVSSLAVGRA